MHAMFILHETDPPDYFDLMKETTDRVVNAGGTYKVVKEYSSKFNADYYEYHFECEDIKDLVG